MSANSAHVLAHRADARPHAIGGACRLPHGDEVQSRHAHAKPFLKWVGGKRKLLPTLEQLYPAGVERMRHVEPFVGGGAMFFARAPAQAVLCDSNRDLVETYQCVRDCVEPLIEHLTVLQAEHSESAYYAARQRYNERDSNPATPRAALFIYLNKTCFNGLYRVNQSGHFNVAMGRYARPAIADAPTLRAASRALARADIRCAPFEALVDKARPGDFIYLDPPYEPLTRTANFTAYAQDGFTQRDQTRLRDLFRELDRRGAMLMLSNSDVPFIRELYRGYAITQVTAARAVNCDATRRGSVSELVIRNYTHSRHHHSAERLP